ncbi:hypothetical protein EC991_000951, partial [Linnemannia zychae]
MTTSPDSQISPQTPRQDEVEAKRCSLANPKQLQGAIPSAPQALPIMPVSEQFGDDTAESNSAKDSVTKTETGSEVQIQGQVQPQDQDEFEPSNVAINERSKKPMVREDEKPSPDPEVVTEQELETPHSPLTAKRPSDDDKVEHVKDDSLVPSGQRATQENNRNPGSVVNEGEVSGATLNDPTACRTQPAEPTENGSITEEEELKVEEKEQEKEEVKVEEKEVKVEVKEVKVEVKEVKVEVKEVKVEEKEEVKVVEEVKEQEKEKVKVVEEVKKQEKEEVKVEEKEQEKEMKAVLEEEDKEQEKKEVKAVVVVEEERKQEGGLKLVEEEERKQKKEVKVGERKQEKEVKVVVVVEETKYCGVMGTTTHRP